jgi:hypothetical protein
MASLQEIKDLLIAQSSKDPRQTLHKLRALVFSDDKAPAKKAEPAPKPAPSESMGTD